MNNGSELALANIGIAVTRPANQAKKLTQLIQDAGGNVISFPLIEIEPLIDYTAFNNAIASIDQLDWVIFISSNAVHNGMPLLIKAGLPKSLRFAAIGPKTAQALGRYDINHVLTPEERFDSESLLCLAEMHNMQHKRVMIVRGVGGREILANTLQSRGAEVVFAECYRRINPQENCDILTKAYAKQQLQSIIVTSSEAMRYLLDLAGISSSGEATTSHASWLKNITICVNHPRVAELPLKMGLNVIVTDTPGDEAMVKLLSETTFD